MAAMEEMVAVVVDAVVKMEVAEAYLGMVSGVAAMEEGVENRRHLHSAAFLVDASKVSTSFHLTSGGRCFQDDTSDPSQACSLPFGRLACPGLRFQAPIGECCHRGYTTDCHHPPQSKM